MLDHEDEDLALFDAPQPGHAVPSQFLEESFQRQQLLQSDMAGQDVCDVVVLVQEGSVFLERGAETIGAIDVALARKDRPLHEAAPGRFGVSS